MRITCTALMNRVQQLFMPQCLKVYYRYIISLLNTIYYCYVTWDCRRTAMMSSSREMLCMHIVRSAYLPRQWGIPDVEL